MVEIKRRKSRIVKIGKVSIGGNTPIAIQSMTKFKTADISKVIGQVVGLEKVGCQIVRLAVKDQADARAIKRIKPRVNLPIVADIHFDYRLALEAIDNGADKIRLNPGNIYKKEEVKEVVQAAKINHIPIRVGVNSGSVRSKQPLADSLVKSAMDYIRILEGLKFYNIVISLKASNVLDTVSAYRKIAKLCDYPLHLGVTATGSPFSGAIKSSIALGALLLEGIGDTIRVSLTADPKDEIAAAKGILSSLGLRNFGPQIISCPTCGRCEVDLVRLVSKLEKKISAQDSRLWSKPLKVAVMGCVVNGPGEAKEADIGVAFGKKEGLLFRRGRLIKKVSLSDCLDYLLKGIGELND
ncbi:MAG: flavodoxin-dependent (E)-4-hydroxy-3-methylbut-2-enyl-diphosphate synthase [Candidatus Omnitrophica bacterium]|nr:flavodoxin-dependent (E)-4-hydroxy-3-methylbut-2-enyl-diphosphate synthase [Candidatus Omnitrophota bacterium]